jgi:hypothetical protein
MPCLPAHFLYKVKVGTDTNPLLLVRPIPFAGLVRDDEYWPLLDSLGIPNQFGPPQIVARRILSFAFILESGSSPRFESLFSLSLVDLALLYGGLASYATYKERFDQWVDIIMAACNIFGPEIVFCNYFVNEVQHRRLLLQNIRNLIT